MASDLKIDNDRLTWWCDKCGTKYEICLSSATRSLLKNATIQTIRCNGNGLVLLGTVLETAG